jgi:pimeloyl-ACP methyl ester carboxylesterase
MPTMTIHGVPLVYEDVGTGTRPLVLVHGLTGFRDDFREQLTALSGLGRTILYDHRGHGESGHAADPASYSFAQLVADLDALLGALGVAACDLLGHSMGGMVALRFTVQRPERVASLICMDTAARVPDRMPRAPFAAAGAIARSDGMATLAQLLRARAADEADRPAAERRLEAAWGEAFWERRHKRLTAMDPEAFNALVLELVDQPPMRQQLAAIRCPTTVIVGDQDVGFLAPSAELAAEIPGARLVTIPDAAHSPQLENPAAWFAAVREHLARVRGAAR